MSLNSRLFSNVPELEACLVNDAAHITPGSRGQAVGYIQGALWALSPDELMDPVEIEQNFFGPSTKRLVLKFKVTHDVVNRSYQSTADAIVGKMTIWALDTAVSGWEARVPAEDAEGALAGAPPVIAGRIRQRLGLA